MFQGSLGCGSCLKVAVAPPHTTSCQSSAKTRPHTLDLCCMPHHLAGCRQRSQQCAQARGQQQRVSSIHLSAGGHLQALGIRVMLSVPSADTDPLANVLLTIGRSEVSLTLHWPQRFGTLRTPHTSKKEEKNKNTLAGSNVSLKTHEVGTLW